MTDQSVMAAVYTCELKLDGRVHKLNGEQKEDLERIITDLQSLRSDLTPNEYFGELE